MQKRSNHRAAKFLGLLLTASFLPATAFALPAADEAADDPQREDIVVNGQQLQSTQLAAEAITFGNNVQIVGSEDIAASGASNFAEIAQFLIKGANVGYSPDEGEYTIRLDGGGDRDTLVVLDGVPLYDRGPALENIWGSTTIDPHMIDRVEVFRGGNSLFFGSNGGVGVVSLVTKKPTGEQKFEFGASYGSFSSREIWGNATVPLDPEGRHSVMVYGSSQNTDSNRIFAPEAYVDNVVAGGGIQKFPVNRNNVGIKYLWKVDEKTEFRLNGQFTQIEFHDPFPDTNTYSPNRVRYPIVDFSIDRQWSDMWRTELTGYWSNPQLNNTETFPDICRVRTGCIDANDPKKTIGWGKWTGRNLPFPNQGFGPQSKVGGFQELGLNFRNTFNFRNVAEIVGGVQVINYKNDSDPVFPVGDDATTVTGLYADLRPVLPFSPGTKVSLAGRIDFSKAFGHRTIWKFGLRQPIGETFYVRANGGTSYSAPQNNELFAQSPTTVGNPDLKTEETETYNAAAGFARNFGGIGLSGEVGYFRTDITNRIRTTSGLVPNTYFNDSALTQIRGLTADVDLNIGEQFDFNLSFTKQKARPKGSDQQIGETPEYMIQGRAAWHSPDQRIHLMLLPRYQGPEWAIGGLNNSLRHNFGNYFVMNGSLAYWAGDNKQHRFQIRLVNILNEKYAERYGYANMRFSEAAVRGELLSTDPDYYYGYEFEGKPRSVFFSYTTNF